MQGRARICDDDLKKINNSARRALESRASHSPVIFFDKANVRIVKLKAIAGVKTLPK